MTDTESGLSHWATDFNHADPAYNPDAHAIWDALRDGGCPVAHSDRYGGMWAPLTHDLVHEVAYDTDHFTSNGVIVSNARPGIAAPVGPAPPITSDPPFHQIARRLLLPPFSPKAIDPWAPEVRRLCDALLDRIGDVTPGESIVDAAVQYAQSIPVNVIARMLGFPPEDEEVFRGFVHNVIEQIDLPAEERIANFEQLDAYIDRQIADHVANPRDDLTSYLLQVELDGHRLAYEHVRGSIVLLLIAGIDTTWSAIGSSLWHLATNAGDLERLVADPDVMMFAVEEFLRAYAPVTMARLVKDDYDFHGCAMKADEWVLLPFPAANRDPGFFDRAGDFVIDRAQNRHAAFGLGIHRCIGSNLARLEVRVAVERFVRRFPRFELAGDVTWSQGQIRGPRVLPVRVLATA
jgi:cytochrome P450